MRSDLSPQAGRGEGSARSITSRPLEFERDVELGAIGFDLALGIQLQIELDDFGDAKIAQRLSGSADGRSGRLFPGLLAGADQLDDLVDALSHAALPFDVRQDASRACCRKPNIATFALKGCGAPWIGLRDDASCWIKKMAGRQRPSGHLRISG